MHGAERRKNSGPPKVPCDKQKGAARTPHNPALRVHTHLELVRRNQSIVVLRRLRWPHTGPVNCGPLQLLGPLRQESASANAYHSVWKQQRM